MTISANIQFNDSASAEAAVQAVGNFLADVRSITGADNVAITINLDIGKHAPLLAVADTMTRQLLAELDAAVEDRDAGQETIAEVEAWLEQHDSARYAQLAAGVTTLAQALADIHRDAQLEIKRLEQELRILRSRAIATPPAADIIHAPSPAVIHAMTTADLPQQQPPAIVAAAAPPAFQSDADWLTRLQMRFADDTDMLDWLAGLGAGRNTFRSLPKPVRGRIIAAVVRALHSPEDGSPPQMYEYEHHRPSWLLSAQSIAATFGNGRWQSIIELAAQP